MAPTEGVFEAPKSTPIRNQELGESCLSVLGEVARYKKPKLAIQMFSTPSC